MVEDEGLSFGCRLVVSGMTAVDDAGSGVLAADCVELTGGAAELAATGELDGVAEADPPVPTGTFCRY